MKSELTRSEKDAYAKRLKGATREQAKPIWREVRDRFGDQGVDELEDWLISIQEDEDFYSRAY